MKKCENYCRAVGQLGEAAAAYQHKPQDTLYRDGLIQRFEFSVELAWKSAKEYLEDQGMTLAVATPRAVLKEAYAAGLIQDEAVWNAILTARNITSHVYEEETAVEIAEKICGKFLKPLSALAAFYQEHETA